MGRPAKVTSSKTTLDIDPKIKQRATLWAVRRGITLREMVEEGLRLVMAQREGK